MFYSMCKPCYSLQTTPFPFSHHQQPPILISSQSLLHPLSHNKLLHLFAPSFIYSPLHQDSSFSFSPLHQNSETSLRCTCLFHQRLGNLALPHYEIDTISVKQTGATTFPKITDRPFPGPWGISHSPHEGRAS